MVKNNLKSSIVRYYPK